MVFEVKKTDLAGRIGRVKTKSGTIETPALLPVVHPTHQEIPAQVMKAMGFKAVMTNAYITLRAQKDMAGRNAIHKLLDFDGVVMTDSGGYQVLQYGELDVDYVTIAHFQEEIDTDIATILDRPTGLNVPRSFAEETVLATIDAAKGTMPSRRRDDVLWMGPIQGGGYTDLVEASAREMSKLGFDLLAIGSPTEVMEGYDFTTLTQMITAAKRNVPVETPFHLFGAGHPLTIPLATALGCDLYDSASYMLYAKNSRYMTHRGTLPLRQMDYLPCSCPVCSRTSAAGLREELRNQRVEKLALHNLHTLKREVEETKQAITEGRLWELIAYKAGAHPKLWEAFRSIKEHVEMLDEGTPMFKSKALSIITPHDLWRPEVKRHNDRVLNNVSVPKERRIALFIPESEPRPLSSSPFLRSVEQTLGDLANRVQVCNISFSLGVIPVELSEVYPLSQNISTSLMKTDPVAREELVSRVQHFINRHGFSAAIVLTDEDTEGLFTLLAKRIPKIKFSNLGSLRALVDELLHV